MLNLVFELLKLFSEGALPATAVQRVAAAALADGWGSGDRMALKMAKAGARGKHPQNCMRDLLNLSRHVGVGHQTPEPYVVEVPGVGGVSRRVQIFLPHEQYQLLVEQHGVDAYRLPAAEYASPGGMGALLRSWGDLPEVSIETRDVGVIGLHCDGVSYTSSSRAGAAKGVLVASWNVVSSAAPHHRGQRCLLFALNKTLCCQCGCEGFHTWNPLFKVFAWSMNALKLGRAPTSRHDGSPFTAWELPHRQRDVPLARAALLMVRGDWEWLCQCFRFRFYTAESFCFLCEATHSGPMTYFNVDPDAPHRATKLTHQRPSALADTEAIRFEVECHVSGVESLLPRHSEHVLHWV